MPFDGDLTGTRFEGEPFVEVLFSEPMPDQFAQFAAAMGCDPEGERVQTSTDVFTTTYSGCDDDVPLVFHEVVGGGHAWPSSPLAEPDSPVVEQLTAAAGLHAPSTSTPPPIRGRSSNSTAGTPEWLTALGVKRRPVPDRLVAGEMGAAETDQPRFVSAAMKPVSCSWSSVRLADGWSPAGACTRILLPPGICSTSTRSPLLGDVDAVERDLVVGPPCQIQAHAHCARGGQCVVDDLDVAIGPGCELHRPSVAAWGPSPPRAITPSRGGSSPATTRSGSCRTSPGDAQSSTPTTPTSTSARAAPRPRRTSALRGGARRQGARSCSRVVDPQSVAQRVGLRPGRCRYPRRYSRARPGARCTGRARTRPGRAPNGTSKIQSI